MTPIYKPYNHSKQIIAFLLTPSEIIGGKEAKPHSRPYMAYLDIQVGNKKNICGGFLVSKDFVLTAAHCNGDEIMVYLGAHNIRTKEKSQQVICAHRWMPHPKYNNKTFNNDIMLLKLLHRAKLNKWVKTIILPRDREGVEVGDECSVAGWGQTSTNNRLGSDTLQEVDMKVVPDAECQELTERYKSSTMLCAGDPEQRNKSSFQGDSGGPLVCEGTAQGIISFGHKNGTPPRVFTRVSTFIPWIQEMMRKLQP
uniref:Peptidase S1 domain-containing protein n=1 Tax=Pelusios castaneus TaxID=367368 RepID=A0A8C8RZQ5_9SAUR